MKYQFNIAWERHVHERFHDLPHHESNKRRRDVVIALAEQLGPTPIKSIPRISVRLAKAYGSGVRKVQRDVVALNAMELITHDGEFVSANTNLIRAFLAIRLRV